MRGRILLSCSVGATMLASFLAGPAAVAAPPTSAPPGAAVASPRVPATAWTPKKMPAFAVKGGAPKVAWTPTITPPPGAPAVPGSGTRSKTAASTNAADSGPRSQVGLPGGGVRAQAVPAGTVVGAPGLGLLPTSGVEGFALSEGTSASVNLANGNLVLRTTDTSINGAGVPLKLDRFYNSLSSGTGSFGRGSVLSTGRDVGLATDSSGVVTFSGPSGFTATFTPKSGGGYTPSTGVNADLTKNADASFTLVYRRSGEKLSFDATGFLMGDVDRNGSGLALGYSGGGTLNSIGRNGYQGATFTYGQYGVTQVGDSAGRTTSYAYSTSGDLTQVTRPDGATLNYAYDSAGRLTGIQVAGGEWTDFGYDASSRVTSVTRYLTPGQRSGAAATTTFSYASGTSGATSATETNPLGAATTYALDAQGRVTMTTDPLGRSRARTWTPNGDVATATDAMGTAGTGGHVTTYSYDTNNQLTSVSIPTGAATRLAYAAAAGCATQDGAHPYLPKCATDAQGNTSSVTYDAAGNVMATQDTSTNAANKSPTGGVKLTYTRQSATVDCGATDGQVCTSTNGNGAVTTYQYEPGHTGNVSTVTPPAPLGASSYVYDSANRLVQATDGNGKVTKYSYDVGDHVVAITYNTLPNATNTTYTYNRDGAVTQQADPGTTTTYGYDGLGRQTSTSSSGSSPTSVTYDVAGNVTSFADSSGTVAYGYDGANELTSLAEPGTTCPTSGTAAGCTRFGYDTNGNRTSTAYPGGVVQTITYDASGRATRILAGKNGVPAISDLSYSYTAPGGSGASGDRTVLQTKTTTVSTAGAPNGAITAYGYDSLNRLTTATEKTSAGGASVAWGYSYDAAGNRTGATTATPGGTASTTTSYNAADEITALNGSAAGISYDAQGNETSMPASSANPVAPTPTPGRATAYTAANQAASFTPSGGSAIAQNYLGADNNIRTTSGPTTFQNGVLGLTSQTAPAGTTTFVRVPVGALVAEHTTAGSQYYLTDNLGSVIALVDNTGAKSAGYAYDPYGVTRAITGDNAGSTATAAANPYRYTAGYLDLATGLYKFGYRYYDPSGGRFTQPDPSGQEQNAYAYAQGCPSTLSDVSGLRSGGGALIGGLILAAYCLGAGILLSGPGAVVLSTLCFISGSIISTGVYYRS